MFFLNLMHRVQSYNIVRIKTFVPEKILNLIQMNRIAVWDIKYEGSELCFKVVNRDIDEVNALISRFGTNIEVIKKLGFERAVSVLKARKAFFIFAALGIAAVIIFSQFIWKIEINGTRELDAAEMRYFLYNTNVRQSQPKYKIDTNAVEVALLKQYDGLSDVNAEISGTKLIITVVERESPIVVYDKRIPVNLIAAEDGLIDEMAVYNGTPLVKAGDTVKKGDILISGAVNYIFRDKDYVSYVHAMGKILTYRNEEYGDIVINRYKPSAGAEYESEKTIYLFGTTLTINKKSKSEENMYIEEKNKVLQIGWIELPILYDEKKWYNINDCEMKTDAELSQEIYEAVSDKISDKSTILNLTYTVQPLDFYRVNVYSYVKCALNIAIEDKITQ